MPRPMTNRYSDYDIPLTQEKRDAKEKALMEELSANGDYNIPLTKEERLRKEKGGSMDRLSSAGGSRPLSNASSVFSADASTFSSHSSSSSRNSKLGVPAGEDNSSSCIDQQLELINQMVGDVETISSAKKMSSYSTESVLMATKSLEEDSYSHCSSNDNLGVWDDVSSEPDSDEMEGECEQWSENV